MRLSSLKKTGLFAVISLIVFLFGCDIALAATGSAGETLGSVASNIQKNFGALAKVMTGAAYIMGTGFVIGSLFKFKAHKDAPQQVQIGVPIALLFIGCAMIFIPNIMKTGGATIFGSNATSAGVSGVSDI